MLLSLEGRALFADTGLPRWSAERREEKTLPETRSVPSVINSMPGTPRELRKSFIENITLWLIDLEGAEGMGMTVFQERKREEF